MSSTTRTFQSFFVFFRDGFRDMTIGRTLWLIVLIKLFIMFCILKIFFFPNYLNTTFDTPAEKSDHVRNELIDKSK